MEWSSTISETITFAIVSSITFTTTNPSTSRVRVWNYHSLFDFQNYKDWDNFDEANI